MKRELSIATSVNTLLLTMIGKTRHYDPAAGPPRGVLERPLPPEGRMRHVRIAPAAELAPWIAHYWMVAWDLRDCEPFIAETLPHPNVHLIFEEGKANISGVQTAKFSRILEGQSQVFGIKFRPGAFRPFWNGPVAGLADRVVPAERVFGDALRPIERASAEPELLDAANAVFRTLVPTELDKSIALAGVLVERILSEPEIRTVDDLAARTGLGKRSLQRVFRDYVGASPKWVIRRYRLHEVLAQVDAKEEIDWPQLALELGYFDQAHLINDFKSITGYSPAQYLSRK